MKQKEKPKYSVWSNVCFMLRLAWKHQKRVIFLMFLLVGVNVSLNLTELFVAPEILRRVEQLSPLSELLATIGIFTALLLILKTLQEFCTGMASAVGQIQLRTQIIQDLNQKSFVTSYPNTCDPKAEKLLAKALRATWGNDEATEHIWITMTDLLTAVLGFAVYLLLLQTISPVLMISVTVLSIAGFLARRWADNKLFSEREGIQQFSRQYRYIQGQSRSIALAKDIRIFGLQGWLENLHSGLMQSFRSLMLGQEKISFLAGLANVLLTFLRNGIAYDYLIRMALTQDLSAAEFLLYFTAVSGFTGWITGILGQMSILHKESLDLSTVREYLNFPEPFQFEGGVPIPKAESYELKAENVTFRYPGSEKNLFEHLNLTIHPGEKLAVVGLNGAGKTTLVMLLCGFYDPDEGRILLNGQDIRTFNRRDYYSLLSAVYQQYSVVDVTVAQNVASSTHIVDREKVWSCLQKAGLSDFVKTLPKQLDTPVGRDVYLDGVLFSGGQTQRLMLARALYQDGPILVLDEPTAALDPIAENDIYLKYNEMTSGKTSLFISHRLASTRFCDRIIFLTDGRIAEEGTHESLLCKGGEYAKLFEVQSRYYQEGRDFR